ncbi:MAG: chromophore lyase CpcT/CpeT [Leptolyngbyaceae cyanobacterium]
MNRHPSWQGAALLLSLLWNSGAQIAQAQSAALSQQHVDAVATHLSRPMDTTEQAAQSDRFIGVQMTTCPITVPGQTGLYLYQEQALSESLDSPYRQRFLQIGLSDDSTRVESRTFKPAIPQIWTGLCAQSEPTVDAGDLGQRVCTVSLRPSALGYVGTTPAEGCPVNLRGAVRLTNTVVLHQAGMDTWDRGFDADGIQVWGASAEPYRYRWQERRD